MIAFLSRDMATGRTFLVDLNTNERTEYETLTEAWKAVELSKEPRKRFASLRLLMAISLMALCFWSAFLDWRIDQQPEQAAYTPAQIHTVDDMVAASMCADWLCRLDEKRRAK